MSRGLVLAVVVIGLVATAGPEAFAGETYVCWIATGGDGPDSSSRVIRCRIAGNEVRDFTGSNPPPVVLLPAVGTDASGGCWYRRSWWSGWSLVTRYPDGSARLRYDPDGIPGGPVLADAVLPGCTAEPAEAPSDVELAWGLLTSMRLGSGAVMATPRRPITGLVTYLRLVGLDSEHHRVLVSPVTGHRIEVRASAGVVTVDWGDGSEGSHHDAGDPALAAPRPATALRHRYERAGPAEVRLTLGWEARWRVDSGPWRSLPVAPVASVTALDVDEIVSRLLRPGSGR